MADNNQSEGGNNTNNDSNSGENSTNTGAGGSQQTVVGYMLSDKVEAGLWLSRLFTVVCTILFFIPIVGSGPYGFYQRALISNAVTSALRLHQRIPNFQFNRQFLGTLLAEDSCHYLFFSLIFINSYPISMSVMPVFLFALLHACNYTKNLLNIMGPNSLQFVRNMINKLQLQQIHILRFIACTEIFIMPAVVFMTFTGKCSFFLPIIYYRFVGLRYASRRNPYCRTLFTELRMTVEYLTNKPQCPQFVRNISRKGIDIISRLAPQMAAAQ